MMPAAKLASWDYRSPPVDLFSCYRRLGALRRELLSTVAILNGLYKVPPILLKGRTSRCPPTFSLTVYTRFLFVKITTD